jgi:hypothetical protein
VWVLIRISEESHSPGQTYATAHVQGQEFKIASQIFANDIRGTRNSANGKPVMLKLPIASVDTAGHLCSRRSLGVNVKNAGNRKEA